VADTNGDTLFVVQSKLDRALVRESQPSVLVVRDYKSSYYTPKRDVLEGLVQLWSAKNLFGGYQEYVLELEHITMDGINR
jgi:hypothetical protein